MLQYLEGLVRHLAERSTQKPRRIEATLPVLGPERVKTSVYLDPLVWRSFRESCTKVGQSTCGVLEPFMYAFHRAVSAGDYHDPRPITVNLQVSRVVQRVRRRGVERIYDEIPAELGHTGKCFMCGHGSVYKVRLTRVDPMRDGYVCAGCHNVLKERGGILVLELKSWDGSWVDPGDLRGP